MKRSAAALAMLVGACTRRTPSAGSVHGKSTLSIKGSDTMVILGQRWAEDFMMTHPLSTVEVTGGGSGTGIAALINGSTDICESSRPMKDAEKADVLAKRKTPAIETKVALDALAVYVNERNPVRVITLPALAGIYSGETSSWKDLGGADHAIILYGRDDTSGTYGYFKERILAGRDFAPAAQALAGTSAVANAVKRDEFGIGYGGIAYVEGVRALALKVDATAPAVLPTRETAQGGTYPVARYLYFYTAGAPTEGMRTFIDWVTGPAGQRTISDVGYYPLPSEG